MAEFWNQQLCNAANSIRDAFIRGRGRITVYIFDALCRQHKADRKAALAVFVGIGMCEVEARTGKSAQTGIAEYLVALYANGRPL